MFKKIQNKKRIIGLFFGFLVLFSFSYSSVLAGEADEINIAALQASGMAADPDKESTWSKIAGYLTDAIMMPLAGLSYGVLSFVSMIVGISGFLFRKALEYSLYTLGDLSDSIYPVWEIFRDLANILIVFILIYLAIRIILGISKDTGKSIATVIIVAILINFSLFFTKTFIDLTNITALNIYNSFPVVEEGGEINIAESYLIMMNLKDTHSDFSSANPGAANAQSNIAKFSKHTMSILLLLALGGILLFAGILFITRTIVLLIVLVLSSVAVGSLVFPKLKSMIWDKWFNALIGQSLFAPIFLLFFLIGLYLTNIVVNLEVVGNLSGDTEEAAAWILNYAMILGFFVIAIIVSKGVAGSAGGAAPKITSFIAGTALGASAAAGRFTGGKIGSAVAHSEKLKDMANNGKFGARTFAKMSLVAGNTAAKSTFDARNSKIAGNVAKATGLSAAGIDLGKASTITQAKKEKAYEEHLKNRAEMYELSDVQKKAAEKKIRDEGENAKIYTDQKQDKEKLELQVEKIKKAKEKLDYDDHDGLKRLEAEENDAQNKIKEINKEIAEDIEKRVEKTTNTKKAYYDGIADSTFNKVANKWKLNLNRNRTARILATKAGKKPTEIEKAVEQMIKNQQKENKDGGGDESKDKKS